MQKSLVELDSADFEEITKFAALFFTPREVALIMEVDEDQFAYSCSLVGDKIYTAFHSGRLQAEVDLRTSIIKMAKAGSGPAQTMAMDLHKQSKLKMLNR